MLSKSILFSGQAMTLACDGRCDKAWGINGRPRTYFDASNPDDYIFIGDQHLSSAPGPGRTKVYSEGGDLKPSEGPLDTAEAMNRWCTRECERSVMVRATEPPQLPDMDNPRPNIPKSDRAPV